MSGKGSDAGRMPIIRVPSRRADREIARVRSRFSRMAGLAAADPKARELSRRLFGRPLSPAEAVREICGEIDRRGDAGLVRISKVLEWPGASARGIRVPPAEVRAALRSIPEALRAALTVARDRIADYHRRLMPAPSVEWTGGGMRLGVRWTPIERVGVYVPGGRAAYPSSVLMNVIPARVAGVERICVCTPPGRDGSVSPAVLAACALCGVEEVYRVGGAHAVAALAFGTRTIPAVDKIVGPGNLYVTLAKQTLFGIVDVDMLAGPSEVVVLADRTADPVCVAADMLAQAEHDPMAAAALITDHAPLAGAVRGELARQLEVLPRAATARESLASHGLLLLADNMESAARAADALAPEHLELMVEYPDRALAMVRHAGAIFLGPFAPESLGDYVAGPSHTLPTGGTARAFSGLSVWTFLKRTSLIGCTPRALRRLAPAVREIAAAEGLEAHWKSYATRLRSNPERDGTPGNRP
ncbi:MAG: histidinol dehydrogenase [Planctomycetota bacterium]|nr:histidinol dehydrogenase [Planctomycetota bacterium]